MTTTTTRAHLRLVCSQDPRDAADAYLAVFRHVLAEFLAVDSIGAVRIEGALLVVQGEPCLGLVLHEPSPDAIVNTKIFAAVQATTTYLGVMMDGMTLGAGWTWGDVRIETRFVASSEIQAIGKAAGRLQAL